MKRRRAVSTRPGPSRTRSRYCCSRWTGSHTRPSTASRDRSGRHADQESLIEGRSKSRRSRSERHLRPSEVMTTVQCRRRRCRHGGRCHGSQAQHDGRDSPSSLRIAPSLAVEPAGRAGRLRSPSGQAAGRTHASFRLLLALQEMGGLIEGGFRALHVSSPASLAARAGACAGGTRSRHTREV